MVKRAAPSAPDYIELNVGGYLYATTRVMLASAPPGRLHNLDVDALPHDADGHPFIDRDGVAFEAVMSFLRTDIAIVPRESTLARVATEMQYYFDTVPRFIDEAALDVTRSTGMTALVLFARVARQRLVHSFAHKEDVVTFKTDSMAWHLFCDVRAGDVAAVVMRMRFTRDRADDSHEVRPIREMMRSYPSDVLSRACEYAMPASAGTFIDDASVWLVFDATTSTCKAVAAKCAPTNEQIS